MRPTAGADERQRWDALMATHHYLPFRGLVGRSVRHVAVLGEHWLALVGWHAGAFKLKARDRWIGWLPEQQFRRLHLIANNARFVILPRSRRPGAPARRARPGRSPCPGRVLRLGMQPCRGSSSARPHAAHELVRLRGERGGEEASAFLRGVAIAESRAATASKTREDRESSDRLAALEAREAPGRDGLSDRPGVCPARVPAARPPSARRRPPPASERRRAGDWPPGRQCAPSPRGGRT